MLFSFNILVIASGPIYSLTEIAYRIKHDIPVVGGVVHRDDLQLDSKLLEAIAFHKTHYGLFSKSYLMEHFRRTSAAWSYEQFGDDISDDKANARLRQKFTELSELADCPVVLLIVPALHSSEDSGRD